MGVQQGKNEAQAEIKGLQDRIKELESTCMVYWANRELLEEKIAKLEAVMSEVVGCYETHTSIPYDVCTCGMTKVADFLEKNNG